MTDDLQRECWDITSRGEWLQRRKEHLTASRIAALWDQHPFLSRDDLAAELRGERWQGDNPAMRAGRILEPAVAAAVAEEHPEWPLTKATTYHWLTDHRIGCTPDYWIGDDGLLQCKTVAPYEWERWHGAAPLGYVIQTLTELLVTGRTHGILAILVRGGSFPLYLREVPRHPAAEQRIIDAAAAWWPEHLAGGLAAMLSPAQIAADLDDGSHLDWSGDNELPALLDERARLQAAASETEARLGVIDNTLKERIGSAKTAWLPGWVVKYPTINRRAYSVAASSYRRLDVRPTKEDEAA